MSVRSDAILAIATKIRELNLASPYGGDVSQSGRFYCTLFCLPRDLDGNIYLYGTKFIVVEWRSRITTVSHVGKAVFASVQDVIEFLEAAFVKRDRDAAAAVLARAKSGT